MTKTRDLANLIADSKVGPTEIDTSGTYTLGGIAATGDLTLDAVGDIILDAAGSDLKFAVDGGVVLEIKKETGSVDFHLNTGNDDFRFKGSDDGSPITALALDMSEGGAATFSGNIIGSDELQLLQPNGTNNFGIELNNSHQVKYKARGSSGTHIFTNTTSDTERMRIDSSGRVMIGTTTEGSVDTDELTLSGSGRVGMTIRSTDSNSSRIYFSDATSGGGEYTGYIVYEHSNDHMRFGTAESERMRIDSSGNVGIGWTAPAAPLDVRTSHTVTDVTSANTNSTIVIGNTGSGNGIYNAIKFAGNQQDMYIMSFNNGTAANRRLGFFLGSNAGDAVADERLSIIGDGKVGIGTTSPSRKLDVKGSVNFSVNTTSHETFVFTTQAADDAKFLMQNASSHTAAQISANGDTFFNGGNVGIGTSAPVTQLDVVSSGNSEMLIHADTDTVGSLAHLMFKTDSQNLDSRMKGAIIFKRDDPGTRGTGSLHLCVNGVNSDVNAGIADSKLSIDSSGFVCTSTTNNSQAAGSGVKLGVTNDNGRVYVVGASATSGEAYSLYAAGSYRFYVSYSGGIHSTSTSITSISDERLKENIVDLETGLAEVMALKPKRFDWKNGDGKNNVGFIAQEVQTVLPDLIGDFKHDDLDDAKSLRMGDFIPTLVKAIQEQQTVIESLTTRITALEA